MKTKDNKLILVGVIVILGVLIFSYLAGSKAAQNIFRFENQASQRITRIEAFVSGKQYTLPGMSPNSALNLKFELTQDTSFRVKVQFADGKELDNEFGYVGASSHSGNLVEATIFDDQIKGVQLR